MQIGDEVLQGDGAVAAWCACDGALVEDAWVEHRMLGVMPQRKSGGVVPVYMYGRMYVPHAPCMYMRLFHACVRLECGGEQAGERNHSQYGLLISAPSIHELIVS